MGLDLGAYFPLYVDALLNKKTNKIKVVERVNGERVYKELEPEYVFYTESAAGSHQTIFGDNCKRHAFADFQKFKRELDLANGYRDPKQKKRIFESDINPVFRSLADNYQGADTPKLNIAFFDIETAFSPEKGFAPTTDPFNEITAISVYLKWMGRLITLGLCPPTLDPDVAQDMCADFSDTFIFTDERELLKVFMKIIEGADVISGWNSEGYDIPYTINRIDRLLGRGQAHEMCLWGERPRPRTMLKFKREFETYDLVGRVHLDYLALYQKHNTQQLHSYRLDYVGEIETGENKTVYQGTLDELWRKDFVKFIEYNRQDTLLLHKIDEKKKFIELANQVAHANCVLLKTTMGSVALVEQAIINDMHAMGFIVPDRKKTLEERGEIVVENTEDDDEDDDGDGDGNENGPVCGAYVADPKKGIHEHIGCCDINSLYPSAIRALNMSPETIVGQFRPIETDAYIDARVKVLGKAKRAEAWTGIFASLEYSHIMARDDAPITFDREDGTSRTMPASHWYEYIFNPKNQLCMTANGTVFSTAKEGMIPSLLGKWYSERKVLQKTAKMFFGIASDGLSKDSKIATEEFVREWHLSLQDNVWRPIDDVARYKVLGYAELNDQRQLAKKILLNSLYGALLNEALRFYDARLGQSTTLTGRSIGIHMNSKINEIITGRYDYKGDAIIYADTDSSYFSAYEVHKDNPEYADTDWSRDNIIKLYDQIADIANESFPEFMMRAFNTSQERGAIIKAGRELVGSRGLFIKKKKYAILVYDKEGERYDLGNKPGKLKVMGLDLKRADTPKYMQKFLEDLLMDLLTDVPQAKMYEDIKQFRREFIDKPGWDKGTPKKVSALTDYCDRDKKAQNAHVTEALKKGEKGKVNIPWHVRAAMNWNTLCEAYNDRYSMRISDGSKIVVCKLRPNVMKMDSIAFPIDEMHIPQWFKDLPFDERAMENVIIDKKLLNLVAVLDWDLSLTHEAPDDDFFVF